MFKIKTDRDTLLKPLSQVAGVVERRHTLPILAHTLLEVRDKRLHVVATDLEVQISAWSDIGAMPDGATTLSAKKLVDILRTLSESDAISLEEQAAKATLRAGKSRFSLQTLPAADYPRFATPAGAGRRLSVPQQVLKRLITDVQYAMAVQDIRYYLNGLLLACRGNKVCAVATDGHRLAYREHAMSADLGTSDTIVPRKAVLELAKLLADSEDAVEITIHDNQARFAFGNVELATKLIEGKFPDYQRVIPANYTNHVMLPRAPLLAALQRVAVLANEKVRGVRLVFGKESLAVISGNAEQEEAEDALAIEYDREPLDVGFNIAYVMDVLALLDTENVQLSLGDAQSSMLVTVPQRNDFKYVVMPMRI